MLPYMTEFSNSLRYKVNRTKQNIFYNRNLENEVTFEPTLKGHKL